MKKASYLLKRRGITCDRDEALHAPFGKYRKELVKEKELHQFSDRAKNHSIALLDSFNDLRNKHSLAHDRELINNAEARFIFNSVKPSLCWYEH